MTPQQRIRLARRHAGLSQATLGTAVGVQRSAVGHWDLSLRAGCLSIMDIAMAFLQ